MPESSQEDPLEERAVEQMVVGVSTRKYNRSLEPNDDSIASRGTSKSAVSRRFVAATTAKFRAWMARDLSDLNLVAVMIDGVHFAEHVILVALGFDREGRKHVLGLWEGATENSVACKGLLGNLRDRGLNTERSMLFVIDGAKAIFKAAMKRARTAYNALGDSAGDPPYVAQAPAVDALADRVRDHAADKGW